MKFKILDISGDAGIIAYGDNCEDAFMNAGAGMYSLITDLDTIQERQDIEIEVKGDSPEGLLIAYLNELIFRFDAYGFVGKRIEMELFNLQPSAYYIKAKAWGEEFDPDRHERRLLVKAATYHNIRVEKINDKCEVEVIFDI